MNLKILFLGWNENGEKCLLKLLENTKSFSPDKIEILKVLVPKGYKTSGMYKICDKYGLKILEIENNKKIYRQVSKHNPNLTIVASFPWLLSPDVFNIPDFGTINVHAGELPKYRGYHPLNWAIIRGEKKIGVTVHYIDEGMDSGDIIMQKTIPILEKDNVNTVRDKITSLGSVILLDVVRQMVKTKKKLKGRKQNEKVATYAPKRKPEDSRINWKDDSEKINNLIRASRKPYSAYAFDKNKKFTIEEAESIITPGTVLAKKGESYLVLVGKGAIWIKSRKNIKLGDVLK